MRAGRGWGRVTRTINRVVCQRSRCVMMNGELRSRTEREKKQDTNFRVLPNSRTNTQERRLQQWLLSL